MRINRRLALLVTAPLTVAVAFSGLALAPATNHALQAHRLTAMVTAAAVGADLADRVQRERAAATALVSGQGDADAFRTASAATDRRVTAFRQRAAGLSGVPGNARRALDRAARSLGALSSLRAQVRSGSTTVSALAFRYRIVVADLGGYREGIAQADGVDAGIADRVRAAAALSEAAEYTAQQQVTVARAQASGGFTPASRRAFDAGRLGYTESLGVLYDLGPGQWRTWLERTLSGPKALTVRRYEDAIGRSGTRADVEVTPGQWQRASADRQTLLRSVQRRVDADVLATVSDTRTALVRTALIEALVVVLTLVGAVVLTVRIGRVMVRRLRALRDAAHQVAHTGLPAVMSELSRPGALRGATPEEVAERTGAPVAATGGDEIGEVGEAFNAVHHEAVRLAAQQAHAHAQFAETLVGVARRGAQLTSVMVSELDTVQRDEADPRRMQHLFALDHLAVRMERNTNNLLVLGGYGNARVRPADVDCATVVVAAAQQIERFERVSLGLIEPDVAVTARAVHDVAHILAELLDNATRFSPPETTVGVTVWRLRDRAVVQVVDEGVGISAERRAVRNAALREPQAGIGDVRFMGLHVVARLAARHGIVVELRDSAGPGTIAEVTLPASVLATVPVELPAQGGDMAEGARTAPPRRRAVPERSGRRQGADAGAAPDPGDGPRERHNEPSASPEPSASAEPGSRVAGVSASGLPVRRRDAPQRWPGAGRDTPQQRPGGAPARQAPRRRDSRQVSDVLAAYTSGVSRSARRRERTAADDTERSE
ncbi:HAMP domain-containing protein [Streptomyces griseoviridis]|uniref:histidine kinase n=1 Tax=Streptomyces griseoviridis TaxID=45398 RepID=A0A3S9ZM45_STRGD|nr:sensor histidine kinase [Streptomyces griseoviridis]AZS88712.1 HAMP domain-containing protein [Streptomyces griseoviridis]QCN84448.1 histidine kinase [Streptomyces griseoviridis]